MSKEGGWDMGRGWVCFGLIVLMGAGCVSTKCEKEVRAVQLVKATASWNGKPLPAFKADTPEVTIMRITIPPKQSLPIHTHPVINAGILLKGQLTVTTESGQVLHLKADDAIVEVTDTWHFGRNDGDVPAEIVVFYVGEKGTAITVKKTPSEQTELGGRKSVPETFMAGR